MTNQERRHLLQSVLDRIDAKRKVIRTDIDGWNTWVRMTDVIDVLNGLLPVSTKETRLTDCEMSVRLCNILHRRWDCDTIGDIEKLTMTDINNTRHLGKITRRELMQFISKHNLQLKEEQQKEDVFTQALKSVANAQFGNLK